MRNSCAFKVLTIIAFSPAFTAAQNVAPTRNHDIEPEDYFDIVTMTECAVSPDGIRVAYTEMAWGEPKQPRTTELWVVSTDSGQRRRLTFDRVGAASPQWNVDDGLIYFTAHYKRPGEDSPPYDGTTQVWRVSPDGGPPFPVTRIEDGVGQFVVAADGKSIYYAVATEHLADEWKNLQKEFSDLEYGHGVDEFTQIWSLDLESWRENKLIDQNRYIRDFAVSPTGNRIAMITTPDDKLISNEGWSRVDVYDTATEKIDVVTPEGWRKDHPSPYGWLGNLAFSADGDALAFGIDYDGYPSELYAVEWTRPDTKLWKLKRPGEFTVGAARPIWRGQSRDLCFLSEVRAHVRVACIKDVRDGRQGEYTVLTPDKIVATAFDMPRTGHPLAVVLGTTQDMGNLYLAGDDGKLERVTNTNPQADTWKLPQISTVTWKGANGDEVEGILELPPDYKEGDGPLPMVLEIHGGPTAATYDRIRFWIYGRTLMPAKGYALLSVNYRGSTGYGDKFLTELIGHENDIEVTDILTGVDAMVERGIADPDRLAVMGWSNGGYLTNCLITHTTRFKAASSGAGIVSMLLQWATEDTPNHVINFQQGLPWQTPDAYRKSSPIFAFENIKTPTLIHVGGDDHRCPPGHSKALYRALYRYLDVPTQIVIYPGEHHGLVKRENRLAKMKWDLAWFDKYLLGKKGQNGKAIGNDKPEE